MGTQTHSITISNSIYYIQGSNTEVLKEIAEKINLKYDKLEPSRLSAYQNI